MAIFAVSFLPQLAAGKSAAPTARRGGRDDKGEGGAFIEDRCRDPRSQKRVAGQPLVFTDAKFG
jgi:hypothetical protein